MAQLLTKRDQDGHPYIRPPNIEAAIDTALRQDLKTISRRSGILDRHSSEYLPSECLVHLIREGRRRNDRVLMNELLPHLLGRCEAILKAKVSDKIPNANFLRDEILAQFSELFAVDGTGENPDSLDFFEVRFNLCFRTFRIDLVRKETKANKLVKTHQTALPENEEYDLSSDDEVFVWLSEHLRAVGSQESSVAMKDLIDAISALPAKEREAVVLCHILDYPEEADDPDKTTAATLCGVTGRTIRNRLKSARIRLSRFKEDLQ
jgi:hypothetical protein